MSRHRDIRNLDYDEEYDEAYDDAVYGHSWDENELGVSPSTAEQYLYSKRGDNLGLGAYFPDAGNIKEEEECKSEDEASSERSRRDSTNYIRPTLSSEDEIRLFFVMDELRNIVGENFSDSCLTQTVLEYNYDMEASLNALLNHNGAAVASGSKGLAPVSVSASGSKGLAPVSVSVTRSSGALSTVSSSSTRPELSASSSRRPLPCNEDTTDADENFNYFPFSYMLPLSYHFSSAFIFEGGTYMRIPANQIVNEWYKSVKRNEVQRKANVAKLYTQNDIQTKAESSKSNHTKPSVQLIPEEMSKKLSTTMNQKGSEITKLKDATNVMSDQLKILHITKTNILNADKNISNEIQSNKSHNIDISVSKNNTHIIGVTDANINADPYKYSLQLCNEPHSNSDSLTESVNTKSNRTNINFTPFPSVPEFSIPSFSVGTGNCNSKCTNMNVGEVHDNQNVSSFESFKKHDNVHVQTSLNSADYFSSKILNTNLLTSNSNQSSTISQQSQMAPLEKPSLFDLTSTHLSNVTQASNVNSSETSSNFNSTKLSEDSISGFVPNFTVQGVPDFSNSLSSKHLRSSPPMPFIGIPKGSDLFDLASQHLCRVQNTPPGFSPLVNTIPSFGNLTTQSHCLFNAPLMTSPLNTSQHDSSRTSNSFSSQEGSFFPPATPLTIHSSSYESCLSSSTKDEETEHDSSQETPEIDLFQALNCNKLNDEDSLNKELIVSPAFHKNSLVLNDECSFPFESHILQSEPISVFGKVMINKKVIPRMKVISSRDVFIKSPAFDFASPSPDDIIKHALKDKKGTNYYKLANRERKSRMWR